MSHRYFDDQTLGLLSDPGRWNFVSTRLPPAETETGNPTYRRWQASHGHTHAHREVLVAITGEQLYGHAVGTIRCRPGTILFVDSGEVHDNGYLPGSSDFVHLWFSVTASGVLAREYSGLPRGGFTARPLMLSGVGGVSQSHVHAILTRHRSLTSEQRLLARLNLTAAVTTIIALVIEAGWQDGSAVETDGPRAAQAVSIACEHIKERGGVDISLDGLAQMTCYSRFHFLRLFRAKTGCTLREFVDRVRREEVLSVQQHGGNARKAAERIGFASKAAFSRWCQRNDITWRRSQAEQQ